MKKIVSILLSFILLLSCMPMLVLANEQEEQDNEELINVAQVDSAIPYTTSEKNTLWTPVRAINDGKKSKDTWQGWECRYPNIAYGSNTSEGFSGEYCGIKFRNKEYYEIHEIYLNTGMHAAMGGQNTHYTIQCLVEGVWVTVADFHDSDTKPCVTNEDGSLKFESYEDVMKNDTSFYHVGAEISIKLDKPVTTNNVRINISEFAKNYPGGDVLIFPYIYEVELMGKLGVTPDIDLPEGAVISTNIGYHSFPEASSSSDYSYPYCAIDGKTTSCWSPIKKTAGEYLSLVFDEAKKINKAVVNFGTYMDGINVVDYKFNIEANVSGEWVVVATGTAFDEDNQSLITTYEFDEVEATALRVIFTEGYRAFPEIYEFEAHLSTDRTYYIEDRYDAFQRISASKGNIAIIGTPYADKDFVPYSDVNYIIDGKTDANAYVWFTGVIDMPSYCGVKFREKQLIDRVALYFNTPAEEGIDIMGIQIQALIDGEYVTLVTTKSYDVDLKYSPAFKFEPVETDDIRILYTSGNGTFAHLKELEIYSVDGNAPMFDGLPVMSNLPQFIDKTSTASAGEISIPSTSGTVNNSVSAPVAIDTVEQPTENRVELVVTVSVAILVAVISGIAVAYAVKRKLTK